MITRFMSLVLVALCMAGMAQADDAQTGAENAPRYAVTGLWAFESLTHDQCNFTGTAQIYATQTPDLYGCELTARQDCPMGLWVVRQSCMAERIGDQLTIQSEIEEFLEGEPTPAYWPDNFVLKIRSNDRMSGTLVSHGRHATEFTRQMVGIS